MWPVGLVTELGVSSPIVRQGKVIGFYDGWKAYRKFPVDMAGFAVNLKLIHTVAQYETKIIEVRCTRLNSPISLLEKRRKYALGSRI